MPTPNVPNDDTSENTRFAFVADQNPRDLRSHAMREHWKHRRRQKSEQTRRSQQYQPILAKTEPHQPKSAAAPALSGTSSVEPCIDETSQNNINRSHSRRVSDLIEGIPTQVLSGMNLALSNSRLDPFDRFPVKLTAQHHKLLYHWLSIYATMMFDSNQSPSARFNPMRDIWFPLDLCNAAAFNAVMAQSAAHLSRMQGFKTSAVALKFKAEAMRIISLWMADKDLALGDDVIAAVSRILIYERYWGTEAEWQVHRRGLLQIIDARGGIASLHSNWRLELTIYLISLMAKPSWFDSSNQLWEISDSPMSVRLHPVLGDEENLHRVRCLWLISFIQDMRTLMNNSLETYANGIAKYTAIQKALGLIRSEVSEQDTAGPDGDVCSDGENRRLASLLFISATLQSSINNSFEEGNPYMDSGYQSPSNFNIHALEEVLHANTLSWAKSTENLYNLLFYGSLWNARDDGITSYVLNMAGMVSRMSVDTRRGVERCLLHILRQVPASVSFSLDDTWTPDGLLSSIHGD